MILLRSLAFNLWMYVLTVALSVHLALTGRDRATVVAGARRWARWVLGGLRVLCGIDWEVSGRELLPTGGAALIAPMHQSAFDTLLWILLVPDCTYVLKRELTRIPVFGGLLLKGGMIAVDRRAGATAMRELIRRAEAAAAAGRQIVIFPEGTRVAPGQRVKLQPGIAAIAMRTGLPVVPVVTDSGLYWGRRAFRKRPGTIRLKVLPALPAGLPRDALLGRLEQEFAAGLAAPGPGAAVDNSVGRPHAEFRRKPNASR